MTTPVKHTGIDNAPMMPVGATVTDTSWHVAGLYGPGPAYPTERDALVAGIAQAEHDEARLDGYVARVSIDLRWNMEWTQGSLDANGRPTHAAGMEFTVRRTHYQTVGEAREHLARIDAIHGPPPIPTMRNGDTVTIQTTVNLTEP